MGIPKTMWAVQQHKASGKLIYEEVATPTPGKGEVLVKMEYTPINPSDLSFLQGTYAEKPNYPVIPGIEGSGTVVEVGSGLLPKMRMGKRVSCTSTKGNGGSWAEYMLTSAMHVIPIGNMDFKQSAMLIVNPLTAISFIDIAKKYKHKAIVNNAAAGALGKMINRLALKNGIPCINIVHKKAQMDILKNENAKYILHAEDANFIEQYQQLTTKLNANLILDPVGGANSSKLLEFAPNNTTLMLYANLSESLLNIDSRILVQQDKQIQGFYLANYSAKKNILKSLSDSKKVQKLIQKELSSHIHKIYPLSDINKAIKDYQENMSQGKMLINCKE